MIAKKHAFNYNILVAAAVLLLALPGCAKERKKEDMSFDELKQSAFVCVKAKNHEDAIDYLEHLTAQYPDNQNIAKMKLALADEYFNNQNYPSAAVTYEMFHEFYPSNKHAEYAKYQALRAKFYQTLRADCDQTETEHAIGACKEYLDNQAYTKYRNDVVDIKESCEHKLIDKELYVFDFYLKQEQYDAAKNRIDHLRKTYLPLNASLEPHLLYLECKLASKQKNTTAVKEQLCALAQKFPESEFTQMAQALTVKSPFFF